ncbi:MAG: ABC transporter substrate-binding protein [Bacillus sp. (in: firmicutes)]
MKNKLTKTLISLLALLMITACGNTEESKEDGNVNKESSTITLTDAMGEVTIPANPERIIATYLEDALVSLDMTPAAQWSISGAPNAYLQDRIGDVPLIEWNLPLEQVIEANPDLIIFSSASAIQDGMYEEYKKVAPVYVMEDDTANDWRKQLSVVGQVTGQEKASQKVLEDYKKKASAASDEIKASIGDDSVAAIWVTGGQYFLLEKERFAANVLYKDLDLAVPNMIQNMEPAAADGTWNPVTLEALADLDADHVFLLASEGEAGIETLNKSAVWKKTPAASKGQVYEVGYDGSWTVNGKIASDKVIETLKETLIQ